MNLVKIDSACSRLVATILWPIVGRFVIGCSFKRRAHYSRVAPVLMAELNRDCRVLSWSQIVALT